MKHIRTFESFKVNRIDEGLFKSLKNKLSLGFSKMFGSSKEIDKLIEEYRNNLIAFKKPANDILTEYGLLKKKGIEESGESNKAVNEKSLKDLINKYKKAINMYDQQRTLEKQKFDIKFEDVVKDEVNPKVKTYIRLKKIEMEQSMLSSEYESMTSGTGLTEEEMMSDTFLGEIITDHKEKATKLKIMEEKDKAEMEAKADENVITDRSKFDFKKARLDSLNYKWENSKYTKNYVFVPGNELKVWMHNSDNHKELSTYTKDTEGGKDYKGTTLYVASKKEQDKLKISKIEDKDLKLMVTIVKGDSTAFPIYKSKIISTKDDTKEKEESKAKPQSKDESV